MNEARLEQEIVLNIFRWFLFIGSNAYTKLPTRLNKYEWKSKQYKENINKFQLAKHLSERGFTAKLRIQKFVSPFHNSNFLANKKVVYISIKVQTEKPLKSNKYTISDNVDI